MTHNQKDFRTKRKNEGFYKKAKELNVRSRAYFKLKQLDEKFTLIEDNMQIIDLGCAPGGWIEYIDHKITVGKIIGIDLLEIKKLQEFSQNVEILEDDFNNIEDYNFGEFDLVLSDMAPEFSGVSTMDRGRTHKLNLETLKFCEKHLKKQGNLAFKTFEGEDLDYVRKKAKEIFFTVKEHKPQSSQKKSNETFIVCINKKL